MNALNQTKPAAEDVPPELLHEVRALLNEFQELDPSAAGYSEAVTALREARDAMAAAVTGCDPAYVAARREGAAA
ncbi:hypothetical protein H7J71_23010 [Mycolicibacterium peregrinum]|uniref:hypothetical protein n=1 Tax=Mycolicibacterium peregrinum TaxID=43304 RepID=UPI0006D77B32|nr:hypothetical protein [Mycolicibacterium peregrinum]MCV7204888.1 hypothetical protein [Mycolicibacterium peregrinum]ORW59529.1 hypothetical protein AWC21_12520 [Mycolicibacterium peregrinum]